MVGPDWHSLPRDKIEFDVRPSGHQRWTEVFAADPHWGSRPVGLTQVVDGKMLDGTMHIAGQLHENLEPFETKVRIEFHDEADGRTRLKVRPWLPEHPASPSEEGWLEAFTKLDATLAA